MNYDENLFKEKANKKARRIWLVFALLLSAITAQMQRDTCTP